MGAAFFCRCGFLNHPRVIDRTRLCVLQAKKQQNGRGGDGDGDDGKHDGSPAATPASKETVLLDVRTHKEYLIGRFEGAIGLHAFEHASPY